MVSTLLLIAGAWACLFVLALLCWLGLTFYNARRWPEPTEYQTKYGAADPRD